MSKILYAASTQSHLERFHKPYLEELCRHHEVLTMATGTDVDLPVLFDKHFFSLTNLKSIGKIRRILKRERFDAVLVHTTLAAFLVRAAMIGMRHRPYVLNFVHGYLFSLPLSGMRDRVLLWCERLLRRQTDEIAVMNEQDLQICKTYRLCRGEAFMTRGMGVSIDPVIPVREESLRREFAKEGDLVCLFVGELSHRKNQSFLIRAAKRLCDEKVPIRLLLAGEGADRAELEGLIAEDQLENTVFLLGNREPILPYLSIADLYVSASRSEGLPFNIMEAMSCGLPILASATKGQTDLLADTEGVLYPHGDLDAFCYAVKDLAKRGTLGVGSCSYPTLERYRLESVFEENIALLTRHVTNREGECNEGNL